MTRRPGWHFLQLPGPSNVPDRIHRAISHATVDHRGDDFGALSLGILAGMKRVMRTEEPVIIYPSSGSGAWEAALVNTLSPGDRVLFFETGEFGVGWSAVARRLGLVPEVVPGDWRHGGDPAKVEEILTADREHNIKAVAILHNETSTGVLSRIPEIRKAIDRAGHPTLFMVDVISSLASVDYRHDEWGVDVSIGGSQKGLMLPPGLSFNAISRKAREASGKATLPRSYWDWERMIEQSEEGYYPYTPATNLLYGLNEAIVMLEEEGMDNVFRRHARYGAATRCATAAWGLEVQSLHPLEQSDVLTAVRLPQGHDAEEFRKFMLERFNLSLGSGLGKIKGIVYRIGHLGDFNDVMLLGVLAAVESGMTLFGVPIQRGGVEAAMRSLEET